MTTKLDIGWGLVSLAFWLAALAGARWMTDANARMACVGLVVAISATLPSWLFHRGDPK